jgi:acyl-CoA reductase-like NAD-dependent aldehyde dehydrogenase
LRALSAAVRQFSSSSTSAKVDNPYTGKIYTEVPYLPLKQSLQTVEKAAKAQQHWKSVPLHQRMDVVEKFMKEFEKKRADISKDISQSMGKPLAHASGEINGMFGRCKALVSMAPQALADDVLTSDGTFARKLAREPLGTIAVVAPWNYPLLTAGNSIFPSVLAGNAVVLKHSPRTPLVANHFEDAFLKAGAPEGLVSSLFVDHDTFAETVNHPSIGYVQFTGSVKGGREVYSKVAKRRFIDVGLELGGKDAMYVAEDADMDQSVANAIEGAFYNSGQSCCGVERVYVHASIYDEFVRRVEAECRSKSFYFKLGDPMHEATTLGPIALPHWPAFLQQQVDQAVQSGAKLVFGGKRQANLAGELRFFEPTVLVNTNNSMNVMRIENFGPILSICKVRNDEDAVTQINDSDFGLTASVWTSSLARAEKLAPLLNVGTVFMNRCDYLDPQLAWTGVKNTGKGVSLSKHGFSAVTRLKSYHLKTKFN